MSCPVSAKDFRDLIAKLEQLEAWRLQVEFSAEPSSGGYSRGDPKARAKAAGPSVAKPCFPAISQISQLWTLDKEPGLPYTGPPFQGVDSGPGPIPALVADQASFCSRDEREGINRVCLAFSAGFWGRVALETFTEQISPPIISSPPEHFIVLRACGLGGPVRFGSAAHFQRFRDQTFKEGLLHYGFCTETEIEVFCQGARITVPGVFKPC